MIQGKMLRFLKKRLVAGAIQSAKYQPNMMKPKIGPEARKAISPNTGRMSHLLLGARTQNWEY